MQRWLPKHTTGGADGLTPSSSQADLLLRTGNAQVASSCSAHSKARTIRPDPIPARRQASPTASWDAASKMWKHVSSSGR
jgi:hypothetical protein